MPLALANGIDSHGANDGGSDQIQEKDNDNDVTEPIAVIGFSFTFPQEATSAEAFWEMLLEGKSASTFVPHDRYHWKSFYDENPYRTGTTNVKKAHFIKGDIAAFDAPFFSITPDEAACMDPQQRLLLETAYKAFENAGISVEHAAGSKTSVYIGTFNSDYNVLLAKDLATPKRYWTTGTEPGMLANRLSWFYDLKGPSIQIDTACSSSLNALHLACQSIRCGDSEMALVGGCNIFFNPETMCAMSDMAFLSPDGISYAFDHRANGYSRGEGLGIVVVKSLRKALDDGDTIRAVIRATGSNQDGRTPGITQPDVKSQIALIRDTYRSAGLSAYPTRFFEAHGTGTPLGDPIEARAINGALGISRSPEDKLIIGALKSNIGHLEGASGIAGLIKAILVLEKGIIPKNTWFERVNPQINEAEWNIDFPIENRPWPTPGLRRASVNSFGIGGSNAHVVLDDAYHYLLERGLSGKHNTVPCLSSLVSSEAIPEKYLLENGVGSEISEGDHAKTVHPKLLVFSSSDSSGLARWASSYQDYFSKKLRNVDNVQVLADLAFTLGSKRSHMAWRSFAVATPATILKNDFAHLLTPPIRSKDVFRLAFVFTGQGAHWSRMGKELLHYPVFRQAISDASQCLLSLGCTWYLSGNNLISYTDGKEFRLKDPALSQPICTALQIAIVKLLRTWNIEPAAVIGHSSGEIAAAFCSGAITEDHALRIAYLRGLSISQRRRSDDEEEGMLAVGLSEKDVQFYINEEAIHDAKPGFRSVSVGCINSPANVTLSGSKSQLVLLQRMFLSKGIFVRFLDVDCAYHSKSMDTVGSVYLGLLRKSARSPSTLMRTKMISSISGESVSAEELRDDEYWVRNLISPVRFADAIQALSRAAPMTRPDTTQGPNIDIDFVVEIRPSTSLKTPVKESLGAIRKDNDIGYGSVLRKGSSAFETAMHLAGSLHSRGFPVNLAQVNNPEPLYEPRMLTKLPEYPFNHSQKYWIEGRLSKNFRFRQYPEHELLGLAATDWNPLDARWRKTIRLADSQWMRDHKVNGSVLLPAAASMAMAIEAAKRLIGSDQEIVAYRIQNASFTKAIVLSADQDGTEIELRLGQDHGYGEESLRFQRRLFQLFALGGQEWSECSHGTVIIEFQPSIQQPGTDSAAGEAELRDRFTRCVKPMAADDLYSSLIGAGMQYGPTFQMLTSIAVSNELGEATGIVRPTIPRTSVLHPTILDGMFQMMFPVLGRKGQQKLSAMLPTRVDDVWICAKAADSDSEGNAFQAYAHGLVRGLRHAEFSIVGKDLESGTTVISATGLRAVYMPNAATELSEKSPKKLCYNLDWQPAISHLDSAAIATLCERPLEAAADRVSKDFLRFTAGIYMTKALEDRSEHRFQYKPHLQKYFSWMNQATTDLQAENPVFSGCSWIDVLNNHGLQCDLLSKLEHNEVPICQLYKKIGTRLPEILNGTLDALQYLFSDDLLTKFYTSQINDRLTSRLASYLALSTYQNSDLRMIEVGAGTGGLTKAILNHLAQHSNRTPRFSNYTFTDISANFAEDFREIFKGLEHRATFHTLDVERDPADQGIECESYDFVFAANVLHASSNLSNTLANVRRLLKPGGKLILVEDTYPEQSVLPFVFGVLPGWWLGTEDFRATTPLVTLEKWDLLLKSTGFSGLDIHWSDHEDNRLRDLSIMISTARTAQNKPLDSGKRIQIVIDDDVLQEQTAHDLKDKFVAEGYPDCQIVRFYEFEETGLSDCHCIMLVELRKSLLFDIAEADLSRIKNLVRRSAILLWVSGNGGNQALMDPSRDIATGLIRTLNSEMGGKTFVTLTIEDGSMAGQAVAHILDVYTATVNAEPGKHEPEYREMEGVLHISRIVEASDLSREVFDRTGPQKATLGELRGRTLALNMKSVGDLDSLGFITAPPLQGSLEPEQVDIEIKASGLGYRDTFIASGLLDDIHFGLEFAGVVINAGSRSGLESGDRVYGWAHGAIKTLVRCDARVVQRIPETMSFVEAASIPVAYCTAYHSLVTVARMQPGESILIHSAAGATGQAAVQLARYLKVDVYATVGNEEEKTLLSETYGISEDNIFLDNTSSFGEDIKALTAGRGVDVILNLLRGDALQISLECLAPFGRFIDLGPKNYASLPMSIFSRSITFASVDLSHLLQDNRGQLAITLKEATSLFEKRVFSPAKPLLTFGITQIKDAFRYLQSEDSIGTAVIEMNQHDVVEVDTQTIPSSIFDPDASYLIAGGLGGIGRSVARWMVSHGARNLILLSRSARHTESARHMISELQQKGVKIQTPPCDIANEQRLKQVLEECGQTFPPIKGCIQSSLVLSDKPFLDMTHSSFHTATRPKIPGSHNLHTLLPPNLDFFILLSSIQALIGSKLQANYVCANVYQDALARHRVRRGQKALSINIGLMRSVGVAAEQPQLSTWLQAQGYMGLEEAELHALLALHCDPQRPLSSELECQVVTGLHTPAALEARGLGRSYWLDRPLFNHLAQIGVDEMLEANAKPRTEDSVAVLDFTASLQAVESVDEACTLICTALAQRLSSAVGVAPQDLDVSKPLFMHGADSLSAIGISQWLEREVGSRVSVFEVLEMSVRELGEVAVGRSGFLERLYKDEE
ncbi:MAG: hypothetical protein Q9195_005615 [Heterodermia aff. obscurata]